MTDQDSLKAIDACGMIDAMLHILVKDPGEKPPKKAKRI
jgi:hypothetical protein